MTRMMPKTPGTKWLIIVWFHLENKEDGRVLECVGEKSSAIIRTKMGTVLSIQRCSICNAKMEKACTL